MPKSRQLEALAKKIKVRAKELGFCALGVVSADLNTEMAARLSSRPRPPFVRWEPELRCSPQGWLVGAKSVIVGAVSYRERYLKAKISSQQGYVSPFAREPDYHGLVSAQLDKLGQYLSQLQPEVKYTVQVDSGPGCERIFAVMAGVGWQGKNNFVIVPGIGSFVWLGLLTTTQELPPDQPLPSQCGNCDRCLRACPTRAYAAPNHFDHNLCMAYWAADKGPLTPEQCSMLSKHRIIYGCDYCQLACPHNQPIQTGDADIPGLEQIMTMTASQFEEFFRNTAAGWRGRSLLRRNAVLAAAGNPAFKHILQNIAREEGKVSEYARAVIARFPEKDV